MARIGVNVYAEESLMRSSVVEPLPSPGLEGRGSQYIPGPATRPLPVPPTTAPERPDAAPVTQKARPRLALAPAEGWFALLFLAATTPSGTDLVFLFYLSFLCFYLGYFGSWLTYRARLPWLVGLVYCSIL